jgi:hypothetical protein
MVRILDKINTVAFSPEKRQRQRERKERPSKVSIRQNGISFFFVLFSTFDLHRLLINTILMICQRFGKAYIAKVDLFGSSSGYILIIIYIY